MRIKADSFPMTIKQFKESEQHFGAFLWGERLEHIGFKSEYRGGELYNEGGEYLRIDDKTQIVCFSRDVEND